MKKWFLTAFIALILIVITSAGSFAGDTGADNKIDVQYSKMALDNSLEFIDSGLCEMEYDAQGHYALAYLHLYERLGDTIYLEAAVKILDNLTAKKDLDTDGYTGWGLLFPLDAFSDGTTNDLNDVYTYTTTSIGSAFIKAYRITSDEKYRAIANEIGKTLVEDVGYWEEGNNICFYYSNSEYDKKYRVHNVNAYTIGLLAELDDVNNNNMHHGLIQKAFDFERGTQLENGNWYYSEDLINGLQVETDLVHFAMYGTTYYRLYEITGDIEFLNIARKTKESVKEKHIDKDYKILDNSSRKWGAAELLVLLKKAELIDGDMTIDSVLKNIKEDIGPSGEYLPSQGIIINESDTDYNFRANSWFAYALAYHNESEYRLRIAAAINNRIQKSIIYGTGLPGGESAQELLAYGEGHCGDYSYLMLRELKKQGYTARIVGVRSAYKNAAHSRVEVKINGKWYTFDPTYGIYYPNSIQEILDNPDLIYDMVGTPSVHSAYNRIEFFRVPQYMSYNWDIDDRDKNIVIGSTITSNTDFTSGNELDKLADNNDITYAAALTYNLPQSFIVDFSQPEDFYRIKINWYLPEISGKSFLIEYLDENQQYKALVRETDYIDPENEGVYEKVFSQSIKTNKVRFTLLANYGQSRMLIKEFKLFE